MGFCKLWTYEHSLKVIYYDLETDTWFWKLNGAWKALGFKRTRCPRTYLSHWSYTKNNCALGCLCVSLVKEDIRPLKGGGIISYLQVVWSYSEESVNQRLLVISKWHLNGKTEQQSTKYWRREVQIIGEHDENLNLQEHH